MNIKVLVIIFYILILIQTITISVLMESWLTFIIIGFGATAGLVEVLKKDKAGKE